MNTSFVKPILGGIAFGTLMFFAGPFILFVLLLKFIFTPFGMGRMMMFRRFSAHQSFYPNMRFQMADKIRSMSDDEYNSFKESIKNRSSHCNRF